MATLANHLVKWTERRQSRRGFIATCGSFPRSRRSCGWRREHSPPRTRGMLHEREPGV
jgi:hypothetical protein